MDSDAVFREEYEYVIGFKIRVTNDELSSTFQKKCSLLLQKMRKKVEKVCDLYLYKNRFDLGDIC